MKRRLIAILLTMLLGILAAGCAKKTEEEIPTIKTRFIMGTVVTVKVYGANGSKIAQEVLDKLDHLEKLMSVNIADSEVSQINAKAGMEPVVVSEDTFEVIQRAVQYAHQTDGLFDPTIGPLVQLWGIGGNHAKVPTPEEIANVLPLVNYKNVVIDEEAKTIYLSQRGMMIDVGGIAKGYAADQAIEIYRKNKVKSAFINIGGNVMVHGTKPDKSLWRIGIQDPRAVRDDLMAVVQLNDQAVVTSGDYERFIVRDGKRYHHILNPKTGYPSDSGLISASIIGKESFDADALSTSVFLMGAEAGIKLAQSSGYEVMLITADKKVIITDPMKGKIEITSEEYTE